MNMKNNTPDFEKMAINIFRAAFLMTENKMTPEARKMINCGTNQKIYDYAFTVSEGNRRDRSAMLFRYVFRAIEVNRDKNWLNDMRKMRVKLVQADWEAFIGLYDIYRHRNKNRCPCVDLPLFPCQESFADRIPALT